MVHMVMLSTEHDYRPGSPQYVWLENDLKSVDRTKTPFIMVGGHRPMYCSEAYPGKKMKPSLFLFENLFLLPLFDQKFLLFFFGKSYILSFSPGAIVGAPI